MGLFEQAQAGDPEALSALVRRHIPLVYSLCKRFPFSEDAFQQGCIGLVKAIRKFKADSDYQFSTYAVPVILGEIRRGYHHQLGWRSRMALKKGREYREERIRLTGVEPSVQDVARHVGIAPQEYLLLEERSQPPLYDNEDGWMAALPDPKSEDWFSRLCMDDILSRMPKEERFILQQRFIKGRSQTELAQLLSVSQSSVSRQEKQARLHFRQAWQGE